MQPPVTFNLKLPSDQVEHILEEKQRKLKKMETKTKCKIAASQGVAPNEHSSITLSAPNTDSLNAGCQEVLKLVFQSQNEKKITKNKDLMDLLTKCTPMAAMSLLENTGITFNVDSTRSITLRSWKPFDFSDVITHFESEKNAKNSEGQPSHVGLDCSKYPKCMNILVLGETGVGKSTFINGLVNHMKFGSFEEAIKSEPEILIQSEFSVTDDQCNQKVIRVKPTATSSTTNHGGHNEVVATGKSATQKPRAYLFEYTHDNEDKMIRIIDTPGIGDTRGIEFDKENFSNILSFIAEYSELHAICILMKPNNSRETLAFRFCIDELLVHLHKDASKNILFCFTNTRGTSYKPAETLATLAEHLRKLHQERGVAIPLKKETLFSFDNEDFRFLCAMKQGVKFDAKEKENFSISWMKSVAETARLFDCISDLPVHNTNDTLCLNNTRQLILALSDPLAQVVRTNLTNQKLLGEKIDEINKLAKDGTLLQENLYKDKVVLVAEEIPYPMTVCTSPDCVDYRRLNNDPNAPLETVYKTVCHAHCYIEGVQVETVPNVLLQGCACMDRGGSQIECKVCDCLWDTHMHIRRRLIQKMEKVIDETTQAELERNGDKVKAAEDFSAKLRSDIVDLQKEYDVITQYGAVFAAFLAENSILPFNDSYLDYVDHLIKEERNKAAITRNDDVVNQMIKYRDEYQQQVNLIKTNIDNKAESVRSVEEIHEMVSKLKSLTHSGRVIVNVQDLELKSIRQTKENTETRVRLGIIGRFFNMIKTGGKIIKDGVQYGLKKVANVFH